MKDSITITWGADDVRYVRPDLTDEQVHEVLVKLENSHDARIGINWDIIEATIYSLY